MFWQVINRRQDLCLKVFGGIFTHRTPIRTYWADLTHLYNFTCVWE